MLSFKKETLPLRDFGREYVRKITSTFAWRMRSPFEVETLEGTMTCEDGYLAVDVEGNPYPIDAKVFEKTFEL